MNIKRPLSIRYLITILIICFSESGRSEQINVAVASNFSNAIIEISREFESDSKHKVTLLFGSTGKHYAQIRNGAPIDIFLSADSRRPMMLEEEQLTVPNSRFTYAIGQLVLWSVTSGYIDSQGDVLNIAAYRHLAIANPKLAPYGAAAKEVLQTLELWNKVTNKMVRGENIGQVLQFIRSGNAELGFVAYSQIKHLDTENTGSFWLVPKRLYSPIYQQAVLLKDSMATRAFISFIKSDRALKIISDYGYGIP